MNSNLTMVFIVLLIPWIERQRLRQLKGNPWDIGVFFGVCAFLICLLVAQWQGWIDLAPMEWIRQVTKPFNALISPSK